ncbi:hypothetical protein JW872_02770 [Candidatus Babeliales bacterium]|nr:hypothetical protein [Candidatus Babeliales bacterium]
MKLKYYAVAFLVLMANHTAPTMDEQKDIPQEKIIQKSSQSTQFNHVARFIMISEILCVALLSVAIAKGRNKLSRILHEKDGLKMQINQQRGELSALRDDNT